MVASGEGRGDLRLGCQKSHKGLPPSPWLLYLDEIVLKAFPMNFIIFAQ